MLAEGLRRSAADVVEIPVADGGEGTLDVLHATLGGEWREATVSDPRGAPVRARWLLLADGTGVIESAQAIGLPLVPPDERRPLDTTSRGVAELMLAAVDAGARSLLVGLGGTATLDAGVGILDALEALPAPTRVACDVRTPLPLAASAYGPQKGATPGDIAEFERRLERLGALDDVADVPGAGAAGGAGAALAALGAELVSGAELVLGLVGFRERVAGVSLVVTGEGTVDRTTWEGKAPSAVVETCRKLGVRCVVFGGVVVEAPAGVETHALSGDPARARDDLMALGERLG